MSEKAYLILLIVYGFFCQGIDTSLLPNDILIGKSTTNFLVRNKRVINHEPGGCALARKEDIKYIVNIRENSRLNCVGAILSRFTVITAATCVESRLWQYQIQSGSPYQHRSANHTVTSKLVHSGNPPHGHYDTIALLSVNPPFMFGSNIGAIHLHVEPVLTGTMALISGWGRIHPSSPPMPGLQKLRSITVPIMNHRECVASYAGYFPITNKHICTYDERKLCGLNDIGTPLVIDNSLVGIHIYKGESEVRINPDVFLDVQIQEYGSWIRENTQFH